MVFLSSLAILDTGFLTVSSRQGQLAAANRVNSGSQLLLKGVQFRITSAANLDKSVTPGYIPSDIKGHEQRSLVSVKPTMVTIAVFLSRNNTDSSNYYEVNDMSLLPFLLRLPHTAGFKAIYFPVTTTASPDDRGLTKQILHHIGGTDTTESQGDINLTLWSGSGSGASRDLTDVRYIPVKIESVQQPQQPTSKLIVTLTGVVTG